MQTSPMQPLEKAKQLMGMGKAAKLAVGAIDC